LSAAPVQRFVLLRGVQMKQVFELETFEDIEKACWGARSADDPVPLMSDKDLLYFDGEHMTLVSRQFVLSEKLRDKGREFVLHCIQKTLGSHFSADKLFK